MQDILTSGKFHVFKEGMCNLSVINKSELTNTVIPFFEKYSGLWPLNIQKKIEFK